MFAGLRKVVTVKKHERNVRLKFATKSENKNYNHFTPIKGTRQRAFYIDYYYYYSSSQKKERNQ
jgi:hypothetical protein